ncbi:unnamed protein product [Wuchereria bancrofti]|uniref:Galactosyltransferase C-terminal domain-containing protein n=1 Tax=Wuchereria bancrofti TaxID=6293 RepID=A0A3P7E167_WUCBA|nr:unnamed protein product [Wuchereria bancrofti]
MVGSILEQIPYEYNGIIAGVGKLHEKTNISFPNATILGVRGPLTAKALGIKSNQKVVLADPGLIADELVPLEDKEYDLGVVPHWTDKTLENNPIFKKYNPKIIRVTDDPLKVISEIGKCKKIVSSSLHGIILADAFGIPRRIEIAPRMLSHPHQEGGLFKWKDYSASHSNSKPFCKGEALNKAIRKATGKVIVMIDSDAYISGEVIKQCVNNILEYKENHLWYVPYKELYRLTKDITDKVIQSDPTNSFKIPYPVPEDYIENTGEKIKYGHRYGAMIMIFPREAYNVIGCFDERFVGWGGEDIALLRALDTLYGKHKITNNPIFHLWHPVIGKNIKERKWDNQNKANTNSTLASRYNKASRQPSKMKEIIDEANKYYKDKYK